MIATTTVSLSAEQRHFCVFVWKEESAHLRFCINILTVNPLSTHIVRTWFLKIFNLYNEYNSIKRGVIFNQLLLTHYSGIILQAEYVIVIFIHLWNNKNVITSAKANRILFWFNMRFLFKVLWTTHTKENHSIERIILQQQIKTICNL